MPTWSLPSCYMANLSSSGWSLFLTYTMKLITNWVQGLISVHNTLSSLRELCCLRAKIIMKHWFESSQQWELRKYRRCCLQLWTKTFRIPSATASQLWVEVVPFVHCADICKLDPHTFIEQLVLRSVQCPYFKSFKIPPLPRSSLKLSRTEVMIFLPYSVALEQFLTSQHPNWNHLLTSSPDGFLYL